MTTPVSKQIKIPVRLVPHPLYAQRKKNNFFRMLEKFAYKHREKLVFVHIVMFLFFLALTIIPVFLPAPQHGDTITNHFTEFSQFMIWGLWFPFVFLSVLATGRSWCGILCPMGAASEWVNRIGFKRHIPKWLKWEGTPIISFSVITILGQTTDVRDETSAMIEIFFGTLLLALLIGFFYGRGDRKRVWCRHVCPIGLLLGIFSRMGIVQFSPKHPRGDHDRYTEKGICPTMIAVSEKRESRHCVQCFRCVKPTSPIAHTKSPFIHRLFAQEQQESLEYGAICTGLDNFPEAVEHFREQGGKGLNITAPFKQEAFNYAQVLTPIAQKSKSVNTLWFDDTGVIHGDNTDGIGLIKDLKHHHLNLAGLRVLILGAGGTAYALVPALLEEGLTHLHVASRNQDKLKDLADLYASSVIFTHSDYGHIPLKPFDLIINATSASRHGQMPHLPLELLVHARCCYDVCYGIASPFLQAAQKMHVPLCLDGLGMLVEQAAASFNCWFNKIPNTERVISYLRSQQGI